eukprot:sb/3472446/
MGFLTSSSALPTGWLLLPTQGIQVIAFGIHRAGKNYLDFRYPGYTLLSFFKKRFRKKLFYKKLLKWFRNLGFEIVTRAWSKSRNVTEIITTAPLSNQITGFMKHYATEIACHCARLFRNFLHVLINKNVIVPSYYVTLQYAVIKSIRKGAGEITPAPVERSQVSVF